jgi:cytochrome c-type protein NapB
VRLQDREGVKIMNVVLLNGLAVLLFAFSTAVWPAAAGDGHDPLRGRAGVEEETRPPAMPAAENRDMKRTRSYAMQPPTIPHSVDNYQIDRFANRCLMCHARTRASETQATPISITHYMDRDGNFLADVAPRRYFCDTCHIVQMDIKPDVAVQNTFEDVESIVRQSQVRAKAAPKKK